MSIIHERGGDIVYILTGKRSSVATGESLKATGTDGVHQVLLEQVAELKKDKEELRADKALLIKQLEDANNTAEELKALYKELAQVKSVFSSATTRTRAPKSTHKKASS